MSRATLPITVQAEDTNGNTILGTYTSPITLSDTDSSGQTSIATSGSDNPPAGQLLSSSDTATLTYKGGTMSTAATIGASASGVSSSNVTTCEFLGDGKLSRAVGFDFAWATRATTPTNYDTPATPLPAPAWGSSTSAPIPIATGQTFDGVSSAISVGGSGYIDAVTDLGYLSPASTTYYEWSASGSAQRSDRSATRIPTTGFTPSFLFELPEQSLQQTCASPYAQLLVIPMPSSWNVMNGSGTCTTVFNDGEGDIDTYAYASNGSYTDTTNEPSGAQFLRRDRRRLRLTAPATPRTR